jgi:hypothetical protein
MMNQSKLVVTLFVLSLLALVAGGCGGEEKKKAPAPIVEERTKAPPIPTSKSVEQIVASLSIDPRIYLDENEAPRSEKQRIAILKFFNAMLQANASSIKGMLSFADQMELSAMMDAGLADSMDEVSLVILKTGENQDGKPCVMAVYEIDLDYQVQLWFIEELGNKFTFKSAETPPNLVDKLSGNWVENYFALKKKRAEIAQLPDEETSYTLAGELTSTDGSLGGSDQEGQPGGPGPSGPGRPGPTGRP